MSSRIGSEQEVKRGPKNERLSNMTANGPESHPSMIDKAKAESKKSANERAAHRPLNYIVLLRRIIACLFSSLSVMSFLLYTYPEVTYLYFGIYT